MHRLLLLALLCITSLVRAQDPSGDERAKIFELLVVGPDGKPVPEASVELRTKPIPTAEQIVQGKFIRKATYGALATADAQGRLTVRLPDKPAHFVANITTLGYGPYWVEFSPQEQSLEIPPRFTAELEAGWTVGGVVVDSDGKPVPGVQVHPSIEFKKRPGDLSQLGLGTRLKTDAQGRWRFDSVPVSLVEVHVSLSHPEFRPQRRPLTRSEFGIDRDAEPNARSTLDRGLTVTGTVVDQAGNPIVGALVRTKFLNDLREAKTGPEGVYRLLGCEPRTTRIVVSAKGRATEMQEVQIEPEMPPVDFQMQPGGMVRLRVLDERDQPVPKARIFFQQWRGRFQYFEFDHVSQYADEQGVWQWNEAPLDAFAADICRPNGMQLSNQFLVARAEEYVFRPPPALIVSGSVLDAETRLPIKVFRVVPGIRESSTTWVRGQQFTAANGSYRIRHTHDCTGHLVRIEADGYLPAVSRDIKSNEGNVTIDFELHKGQDVAATVLTPQRQPAVGARVALGLAGSQISLKNGDLDQGATYCARQDTNEAGRFLFPPQDAPFQLVITHPTGYAHVQASTEAAPATISLIPWARVEGTFRIGKDAIPNVPITLNASQLRSNGKDVPSIFMHYDVTTGKNGRFVFNRVVAGKAWLGRRIMLTVTDGAADVTSSCMVMANLPPGETAHIDLGGNGRAVVGRIAPQPGREEPVPWCHALISVHSHLPDPPMPPMPPVPAEIAANPAQRNAWMQTWSMTPEGQLWTAWEMADEANRQLRTTRPTFTASVATDGSFRIDDMPSGAYVLSARITRDAARLRSYRFSVPATADPAAAPPLDLGVLTLEN